MGCSALYFLKYAPEHAPAVSGYSKIHTTKTAR